MSMPRMIQRHPSTAVSAAAVMLALCLLLLQPQNAAFVCATCTHLCAVGDLFSISAPQVDRPGACTAVLVALYLQLRGFGLLSSVLLIILIRAAHPHALMCGRRKQTLPAGLAIERLLFCTAVMVALYLQLPGFDYVPPTAAACLQPRRVLEVDFCRGCRLDVQWLFFRQDCAAAAAADGGSCLSSNAAALTRDVVWFAGEGMEPPAVEWPLARRFSF